MAKGQDQTLQIFLILFTILLIGFAVSTYFMYSFWSQAHAEAENLKTERDGNLARALKFQTDGKTYLDQMGFGENDDVDTVKEQFQQDMDRYAGTFKEGERKYRPVIEVMFRENKKFAQDQASDKQKIRELEAALLQIQTEHEKQIAQFNAQLVQNKQDLAAERDKFNQARAALENKEQQLAKTMAEQRTKFDTERNDLNDQIATRDGTIADQQRTIDGLQKKIAKQDPSFEVPDGLVKWVNQANNTVWVNLGSADSIRRQVTFAVVDTDAPNVGDAEPKGSIEITQVLSDHLAEARVTEDDPNDPILPGDKIFSPVWHRGQTLHYALAGDIDLNGDGRNDMEQARNLVTLNGGVVDAWVGDDGKIEGEGITVDTRYLVLGPFPESTNDADLRKAFNDLSDQANEKGVSTISLVDFISQMGYKGEDRTVPLGANARSQDFRPRPNPTASEMRPRSPYAIP